MTPPAARPVARLKIAVRGAVQGVGFRPFVFRLASELGLGGSVHNSAQGVVIDVEGPRPALEQLLVRLEADKPPRSFIQGLEASWLDPLGRTDFAIRPSETAGAKTALVLPDIATCADCLREIFDPANRRHRYPFTNCTNCGPRFSIIEALPYDRANTSMRRFAMCPACQTEYDDPRDRRFHAQPNGCPLCGPQLELWVPRLDDSPAPPLVAGRGDDALRTAAGAIQAGRIVAAKGLGGFHLLVAAHDDAAVRRLRERKHREEKPFALMFPSLESVKAVCDVSLLEERLLRSPEAPIVLLRRIGNRKSEIAHSVAPGSPCLGVLLPYTPLHHLLLPELGFPVIATSGNRSDEPICTDEQEALGRLGGIADLFLVHNRPIVRPVDDSVVRVLLGRELVLRRARGYAPLPITLKSKVRNPKSEVICAVGAHLKNTVALAVGPQVFVSQHLGDLETAAAYDAFRRAIADLQRLHEARPEIIAADLHPDYLSTKFAREWAASAGGPRCVGVQHHLAHVLSCMAENELAAPVLGVAWDGTGYGPDGTVWGGEFFHVTETAAERVAHWRTFRLPGGDAAAKEPRRAALGLLHGTFGDAAFDLGDRPTLRAFSGAELAALRTMLTQGVNSPRTSSVGRLFDAVASLIGLRQRMRFEGQAAMDVEFAADGASGEEPYPLRMEDGGWRMAVTAAAASHSALCAPHSAFLLDWAPMVQAILADSERGVPAGEMSARFHETLAEAIVAVARRVGEPRVVLSGGCFQNRRLTERAVRRLEADGFRPYWHQRIPPNDGGVALGQVVAARRALKAAE